MRAHKQTLTREKSVNRIQPKMDPTPRENGIIWMSNEKNVKNNFICKDDHQHQQYVKYSRRAQVKIGQN